MGFSSRPSIKGPNSPLETLNISNFRFNDLLYILVDIRFGLVGFIGRRGLITFTNLQFAFADADKL
jgi:hypothetical protein